jgi:phytoene/squalene synthetase
VNELEQAIARLERVADIMPATLFGTRELRQAVADVLVVCRAAATHADRLRAIEERLDAWNAQTAMILDRPTDRASIENSPPGA